MAGQRWTMDDINRKGLSINQAPAKQFNHKTDSIGFPYKKSDLNTETESVPRATINKYRNKKKGDFGSIKEWDYWKGLRLREKGRQVTAIQCQVTFQLSVCTYIADFVFLDLEARAWCVVDTKSPVTRKLPAYRLKNKMMLKELNIKIIEA